LELPDTPEIEFIFRSHIINKGTIWKWNKPAKII
jgi:hypothetical protein